MRKQTQERVSAGFVNVEVRLQSKNKITNVCSKILLTNQNVHSILVIVNDTIIVNDRKGQCLYGMGIGGILCR